MRRHTTCSIHHFASSPLPLPTSTLTSMHHPVSLAPKPPSPSDTPARPPPTHSQSNVDISSVPNVACDGKQHLDYQQGEEAPQDSRSYGEWHCVQCLVTLPKVRDTRFCSVAHKRGTQKSVDSIGQPPGEKHVQLKWWAHGSAAEYPEGIAGRADLL